MQGVDLELFRDIPGYKAILKAVLKSQIQVLVEQLSKQTGEESVLLTACIEEGTLSHLGSDTGKVFMDGNDNIRSQFLGFCLKRHQLKRQTLQSEDFTAGPTRKRGPFTNRKRNQDTIFQDSPSQHREPVSNCDRLTNVKTESLQTSMSLAKRPRKRQVFRSPVVANTEQLFKLPPAISQSKRMKQEPASTNVKRSDKENLLEESANGNQSTQSGYQSAQFDYQSTDLENQSNECEKQSNETGNQSNGINDQSMEGIDAETVSFSVVTEAGDSVYQGRVCKTDLPESQDLNDTELAEFSGMTETDRAACSDLDELALFLTGDDVNISKPLKPKQRTKAAARKPARASKKHLKDDKSFLHQKLNNDDRPYPCTFCSKRFKERHHLTYHVRTHSGQRPYVCEICNKAFTQTSSLNTHRRIHLNKINCGMCGQTFRNPSDFSNHVCYTTEQLEYSSAGIGTDFEDASQTSVEIETPGEL